MPFPELFARCSLICADFDFKEHIVYVSAQNTDFGLGFAKTLERAKKGLVDFTYKPGSGQIGIVTFDFEPSGDLKDISEIIRGSA